DTATRGPARCAGAVVDDDRDLVERVRGSRDDAAVHLDAHRLQALPEVDAVGRGIEDAARLDVAARRVVFDVLGRQDAPADADDGRRRQRVAGRDDADRRTGELSGGQV